MAPTKTTNAERCRKYRQAHSDKYKQADALRKKHARAKTKVLDPEKYKFKKEMDKLRKREERLRKKLAAAVSNETTPCTSSYKHKSIKFRSLKKVENSLPKSPRKKKEIIGHLASKFNLRIQFQSRGRGRKKDELDEERKLVERTSR